MTEIPRDVLVKVAEALEIGLKIRNDVHPNDYAPLVSALAALRPYLEPDEVERK